MSVIMPCTEDILERLEPSVDECPFCHRDPFHYVDIGVGMDRAAVNCCDLGVSLIQDQDEQLASIVQLHRDAAAHIRDLTASRDRASDACASVQKERDELREALQNVVSIAREREAICADAVRLVEAGELYPNTLTARETENCARLEAAHIADKQEQFVAAFLARYEGGRK